MERTAGMARMLLEIFLKSSAARHFHGEESFQIAAFGFFEAAGNKMAAVFSDGAIRFH